MISVGFIFQPRSNVSLLLPKPGFVPMEVTAEARTSAL